MADNQRVITSYLEVSEELGKKLIKLYAQKIFPRQGKVFADKLFTTGVEAGAYIASLSNIYDRSIKMDLANHAMVKLNTVYYLITIMKEAGYYTPVNVVDLEEFLVVLIDAMRDLLNTANTANNAVRPTQRRLHTQNVPFRPTPAHLPKTTSRAPKAEEPVQAPSETPAEAQAETDVEALRRKPAIDPDGFNAPAE